MNTTLIIFIASLSSVPYDPDLTPGTLEFASGKTEDDIPGSLYFKSGRIRLVHKKGPKISKHRGVKRYSLSAIGVKNLDKFKQRKWNAKRIYEELRKHKNLHTVTPDNRERLIEFYENASGKTRKHVSRGGPITAPALNQVQIDLIAQAANTLCNSVIKPVYEYALSHFK